MVRDTLNYPCPLAYETLDLFSNYYFALSSFLHDTRVGWVGGWAGTVPIELVFK